MDQNPPIQSQPPVAPQPPTETAPHKSNKKLILIIVGMGVVLAFAVALIVVLATKDSAKTTNNSTTNNSQSDSSNNQSTVETPKDIVTVDTQEAGVSMTITGINKSGNTLTVNYKLNHDSDKVSVYASAFSAGVYTINYAKSVPEPYFVSNADGQKYGIVKDSSNNPLASKDVSAHVKKGESVAGFFTLTLPPNNASGSLVVGNISIPGVTIKY